MYYFQDLICFNHCVLSSEELSASGEMDDSCFYYDDQGKLCFLSKDLIYT